MTPVKVWQERVEIPTYETGPQDIHPTVSYTHLTLPTN